MSDETDHGQVDGILEEESLLNEGNEIVNPFPDLDEGKKDGNVELFNEARSLENLSFWESYKSVAWKLLLLAAPLSLMNVLNYLTSATDVAYLGHISETALAAAGVAFSFQSCVGFIAYGIATFGLFTMCSQVTHLSLFDHVVSNFRLVFGSNVCFCLLTRVSGSWKK